jgi:hypothetical protein
MTLKIPSVCFYLENHQASHKNVSFLYTTFIYIFHPLPSLTFSKILSDDGGRSECQ